VRTQVDLDLTLANRFDRPLGLIKNLGHHIYHLLCIPTLTGKDWNLNNK
jgi:hypothetical protein